MHVMMKDFIISLIDRRLQFRQLIAYVFFNNTLANRQVQLLCWCEKLRSKSTIHTLRTRGLDS